MRSEEQRTADTVAARLTEWVTLDFAHRGGAEPLIAALDGRGDVIGVGDTEKGERGKRERKG